MSNNGNNGSGEWRPYPGEQPAKRKGSPATSAVLALVTVAGACFGYKYLDAKYDDARATISIEQPGHDTFIENVGKPCVKALEEDADLVLDTPGKLVEGMYRYETVCRTPMSIPPGVFDDAAEYYVAYYAHGEDVSNYAFARVLMVFGGVGITSLVAVAGYRSGQ